MLIAETPVSAYPGWRLFSQTRTSSSQTDPLHGISASKVYPHNSLLNSAAGSYPAFSPFPLHAEVVIFCGTVSCSVTEQPAVHRWIALRCPDFPPFCKGDSSAGSQTPKGLKKLFKKYSVRLMFIPAVLILNQNMLFHFSGKGQKKFR